MRKVPFVVNASCRKDYHAVQIEICKRCFCTCYFHLKLGWCPKISLQKKRETIKEEVGSA